MFVFTFVCVYFIILWTFKPAGFFFVCIISENKLSLHILWLRFYFHFLESNYVYACDCLVFFLPFFSDLCYEYLLFYMASSNPNNWKLLVLWVFFAPSNTTVCIFSFLLEATVSPHIYSIAMRFSSVFISGQFWYN